MLVGVELVGLGVLAASFAVLIALLRGWLVTAREIAGLREDVRELRVKLDACLVEKEELLALGLRREEK
jgi:hypothetical protein